MSKRFQVLHLLKLFVHVIHFYVLLICFSFFLMYYGHEIIYFSRMYRLFVPKSQINSQNSISKYSMYTLTYVCFTCMFIYIFTLFLFFNFIVYSRLCSQFLESLDRMCMRILHLFLQVFFGFVCVCQTVTFRPWFLRLRIFNVYSTEIYIDIQRILVKFPKRGANLICIINLCILYTLYLCIYVSRDEHTIFWIVFVLRSTYTNQYKCKIIKWYLYAYFRRHSHSLILSYARTRTCKRMYIYYTSEHVFPFPVMRVTKCWFFSFFSSQFSFRSTCWTLRMFTFK